jgi:hypothetical protein
MFHRRHPTFGRRSLELLLSTILGLIVLVPSTASHLPITVSGGVALALTAVALGLAAAAVIRLARGRHSACSLGLLSQELTRSSLGVGYDDPLIG